MKQLLVCEKNEIPNEINISAEIYIGDDAFTTNSGLVNLHPTKGPHWVMFVGQFYFDSNGCPPPLNVISQFIRGIH